MLKRSLVTGTVEGATAGGLKWVGNKFAQSKKVGAKPKPALVEDGKITEIPKTPNLKPNLQLLSRPEKIIVTDDIISDALKNATFKTQQTSVSKPVIQNYVDRILAGETTIPPIKVDGNIIVDGNHRYIASRIAGVNITTIPWSGGNPSRVVNWVDVILDALDWRNR